jgi:hypothetical protein
MPTGTLDLMKLDGQPPTYQIMFEQNAGGTFVARVESDELVPFLHEEMRVDMPLAESAAQRLDKEGRVRLPNIFLEENNLHAVILLIHFICDLQPLFNFSIDIFH